jgi:ribosomal protein S18 acetylase RimI-like enzyme
MNVRISRSGGDRLAELEPLFLALHQHHSHVTQLPLTAPPARAWAERRATYEQHLTAANAMLHVAEDDQTLVGYAFTIIHDASNDTFPLAPRFAELYTLSVAPGARGRGVGSLLFDALERDLDALAVTAIQVAVMAQNTDAIRFYERRGLIPGELLLYRFTSADYEQSAGGGSTI